MTSQLLENSDFSDTIADKVSLTLHRCKRILGRWAVTLATSIHGFWTSSSCLRRQLMSHDVAFKAPSKVKESKRIRNTAATFAGSELKEDGQSSFSSRSHQLHEVVTTSEEASSER